MPGALGARCAGRGSCGGAFCRSPSRPLSLRRRWSRLLCGTISLILPLTALAAAGPVVLNDSDYCRRRVTPAGPGLSWCRVTVVRSELLCCRVVRATGMRVCMHVQLCNCRVVRVASIAHCGTWGDSESGVGLKLKSTRPALKARRICLCAAAASQLDPKSHRQTRSAALWAWRTPAAPADSESGSAAATFCLPPLRPPPSPRVPRQDTSNWNEWK